MPKSALFLLKIVKIAQRWGRILQPSKPPAAWGITLLTTELALPHYKFLPTSVARNFD